MDPNRLALRGADMTWTADSDLLALHVRRAELSAQIKQLWRDAEERSRRIASIYPNADDEIPQEVWPLYDKRNALDRAIREWRRR